MDPQINQLFKTQFMKFAEELKTNKKYSQLHNLDKYYEFIFSQCYKLKWVELEYCIKYPLVLFQVEQSLIPRFIYPRLNECKTYLSYIEKLPENHKDLFIRKVSSIPMSIFISAMIVVGNEIVPESLQWKTICEKVSVYELPTNECTRIVSHLSEFVSGELPQLNSYVTLTQNLIKESKDCKDAIWKLFLQNTKKTTIGTEKDVKGYQQLRTEQRQSETFQEPSKYGMYSTETHVKEALRENMKSLDKQKDEMNSINTINSLSNMNVPMKKEMKKEMFYDDRSRYDYEEMQLKRYGRDTLISKQAPMNDSLPFPKQMDDLDMRDRDIPRLPMDRRGMMDMRDMRDMRDYRDMRRDFAMQMERDYQRRDHEMMMSSRNIPFNKPIDYDHLLDFTAEKPKLSQIFDL